MIAAATPGVFTPAGATWAGSAAPIAASALSGSFVPGSIVWVGSDGTVEILGNASSFIPGQALWAGSSGTVFVEATSGEFDGSPTLYWIGSPASVFFAAAPGAWYEVEWIPTERNWVMVWSEPGVDRWTEPVRASHNEMAIDEWSQQG